MIATVLQPWTKSNIKGVQKAKIAGQEEPLHAIEIQKHKYSQTMPP